MLLIWKKKLQSLKRNEKLKCHGQDSRCDEPVTGSFKALEITSNGPADNLITPNNSQIQISLGLKR